MKTIKLLSTIVMILMLATSSTETSAQDKSGKETKTRSLVSDRNFIFKAQTVLPINGSSRQLTYEYDLRISGDSVVAYLPYFGRAYLAPINPSDGGINFTSTDFIYTSNKAKRDGWDILIKPKDVNDVQQMNLHISENGYATLQVISTNRQAISYNGYISAARTLAIK